MLPWIIGILLALIALYLVIGVLRCCGIILFADNTIENAREILLAELLLWGVVELREWRHKRKQRRCLIRDIGNI